MLTRRRSGEPTQGSSAEDARTVELGRGKLCEGPSADPEVQTCDKSSELALPGDTYVVSTNVRR